jgi:replicative DNA helicase
MNAHAPLDQFTDQQAPKPLPVNIEAEQAVLGALLLVNKVARDIAFLKAEDFSEELHRRIFEISMDLIAGGKLASPITVKTFLGDHDIGGMSVSQYLARLATHACAPSTTGEIAQTVANLARRRDMIAAGEHLLAVAHDAPVNHTPAVIAASAVQRLQEIARSGADTSARVEAGTGASAVLSHGRAIREGSVIRSCYSTGFDDIDRMTGGYEAGLLWIIGARPSQGKSTYSIASAMRTARMAAKGQNGCGAMIFSLEDDERQAVSRALSYATYTHRERIEYRRILRAEDLGSDEIERLDRAAEKMGAMPLTLDFGSRPTVEAIAHKVRVEKDRMAKHGQKLGVVFIDYLKKIAASGRYAGNRNLEFGEITGRLKDLARDEQVCVVLFSQLNRATEQNADKRPTLANLRDSGEIEEDGNIVAFIHREHYYVLRSSEYKNKDKDATQKAVETESQMEFLIEKNKSGPIGSVNLYCDMACNFIANADKWGRQ